ncbi:DEK carboxy-terminal domain protein [Rhynchospora pubera]|uniref:DEK carboxy-terminal domain protein n=1 Tax=Rhynchospora pubera TaxID=906938 RepID=A0AAV8F7H5_9POAL|nr:DEK carboxy-terminal domain protein [Rhynchospora pubera]
MYDNFSNAGHKGKTLKDQLWSAAMATYVAGHEKCMMELEGLSKAAFEWFKRKPPSEWTKSHFPTNSKCDMLLNNLCECFNKYILDARDKPIITMLEIIRTKLMRRFQVKRDEMMKYKGPICPKIQKKLDKWKDEAIKFNAVWNGAAQYQVTGVEGQFVVNIATSSCDCRRWDLTGIPCEHACASMRVNGLVPEEYVHDCYKVETYLKIYNHTINPISGQDMWDKGGLSQVIIPPELDPPKPGRPKKARKKSNVELEKNSNRSKLSKKGRKVVCSICHQEGHNKRWHTQPITTSEAATASTTVAVDTNRKKLAVIIF